MTNKLEDIFSEGLLLGTISGARKGGRSGDPLKIRIRPFLSKSAAAYQFTYSLPDRELHKNFSSAEAVAEADKLLRESFTQAILCTPVADYQVLTLGKGKILRKPPTHQAEAPASHDRKKSALLREDADFLIRLGVSSAEGVVLKGKYDKFRQINKYLELVEGMIPKAEKRPLRIIDFGCGKAYLTFALYHYLTETRGIACEITGLDLKADVIAFCSGIARDLHYDRLRFSRGDIADWTEEAPVDMVVTLHACDTATDAAIAKAVGWGAASIITVPCCQHELFSQITADSQSPLLRHGILKERTAALVTDAARAQLLEAVGYRTDVIEFIDMEHTPKNMMIRARKKGAPDPKALGEYKTFVQSWGVSPCLGRLLGVD